LKKYYEGKMALWSDGTRVLPTDLADDNPLAAKFSKTILNKSMEKKRRMWVKKVLRGDGTPPVQFNDDAGVVSYVASQPGAIGYVTADSVSDSVKTVTVDGQSRF
jgi:ABC-type phosphate transport system substrate-binding protein